MRSVIGNYTRVRELGMREARKRAEGDSDSRPSFHTSTPTVSSQLDVRKGEWLVFYSKGGDPKMLPSGLASLGQARRAARKLNDAGYRTLINRAHKA